jgi:hypothetical protein
MLAEVQVESATKGNPSKPLGPSLSKRFHRMLYCGETDDAWKKSRGETVVGVVAADKESSLGTSSFAESTFVPTTTTLQRTGGKPGLNVTGSNLLTQMLKCVPGVGPEMAQVVNNNFRSTKELVMHLHSCDESGVLSYKKIADMSFSKNGSRAMHAAQAKSRKIGKAVATRIECVVRLGTTETETKKTSKNPPESPREEDPVRVQVQQNNNNVRSYYGGNHVNNFF